MIRQPESGLLSQTNQVTPETGLLGKVDNVQPQTGISEVVPPTDKADGIFAFHGSGADFDEFKLSKIGTGEGNQAFGYGLYFTDSEDIAKFYKNQLSETAYKLKDGSKFDPYEKVPARDPKRSDFGSKDYLLSNPNIRNDFFEKDFDLNKTIKKAEQIIKEQGSSNTMGAETAKRDLQILLDLKSKGGIVKDTGKTYEVKIKAVMDDLIDYDKPLDQQSDKVKKILKPYYEYYMVAETADFGTLLESAYRHLPQDEFSERLAKEGIKGIKYQSGQLSGITDSKATNYVIFDDKIIDIMKKYGIVGAVGVTAMQGRGNQSPEADLSL
jgi:hypothetical protein